MNQKHILLQLRNVGPATLADFELLEIRTIEQLAASTPDGLYSELQRKTARRHDPCVWDTFAAAVHEARTGEALNWWKFTRERKERQAQGTFPRYMERQETLRTTSIRVRTLRKSLLNAGATKLDTGDAPRP